MCMPSPSLLMPIPIHPIPRRPLSYAHPISANSSLSCQRVCHPHPYWCGNCTRHQPIFLSIHRQSQLTAWVYCCTEYSSKIQIHCLIVLTSVVHRWQAYTTLTRPISVFSVLVEEYPACRNPAHPVHNPDRQTVCVTPSNAESFLQCRSSGEHGQLACRSMRSLQRTWHFLFYRLTTLIIPHSLTFSPRA